MKQEIKGFYLPMYYCGYVDGRYYSFPTEDEYLEFIREKEKEEEEDHEEEKED